MTDDQSHLHPLNRSTDKPDFTAPDWEPVPFPPQTEMPDPTPEAMEAYLGKVNSMAPAALQLWPDMVSFLKEVYERKVEGSLWQHLLEPKRLVPPGGYPSPKYVPAALYVMLKEVADKQKAGYPIPPMEITAELIAYQVVKHRVPIYYVAEDFIRAVAATKFPSDLTLYDLKWPQPAMTICFPPKFMKELTGRDISYLFAADLPMSSYAPPELLPILTGVKHPAIECPDKISFQFHTYNQGRVECFVTSWFKKHKLSETIGRYGYVDYTKADAAKVSEDDRVLNKVGELLLKLLLVLSIRDSVLERGVCERKAAVKKGKQQSELWSPHMIGFKYKMLRKPGAMGTHASPGWHMRDGHFTHQVQGSWKDPRFVPVSVLPRITEGEQKGEVDWDKVTPELREQFWNCHERIWIEPMLINFDESKGANPGKATA